MTKNVRDEREARCPSLFALEKLLRGQAGPDIENHVQRCPPCKQRLQEMRRTGEEYLASLEARRLRSQLAEQTGGRVLPQRRERPLRNLLVWVAVPVAIVACVVFLAFPPQVENTPGALVAKGNGILRVVRQRDGRIEDWSGGDLREGDAVQLVWSASEPGYLAVLSQTRHEVAVLFPETGAFAVQVEAGADQTMGGSLTAEEPMVDLRIWAFFSTKPFPIQRLEEALRRNEAPVFHGQTSQLGPSDRMR